MKYPILKAIIFISIIAILLMPGAVKCFGQDNTAIQTVLAVKRLIKQPGKDSLHTVFIIGDKVKVVDDKGIVTMGKINNINDSVLTIKDKQVRISQIQRICRTNGRTTAIVGSSVVLSSLAVFVIIYGIQSSPNGGYGNGVLGVVAVDALIGILGLIPAVGGLINVASHKHFVIGDQWKLITLPMKAVEYKL